MERSDSTIILSNRPVSRRLHRRSLSSPPQCGNQVLNGMVSVAIAPTLLTGLRKSVVQEAGMLELLAAEMRIAELERALATALEEAHLDPLTGALNRRGFEQACLREMARMQRKATSYAIACIDLDDFKKLNDTQGHQTGDLALMQLVRLWQQSMRPSDLLARFGGEEFIMLFPETSRDDALKAVSRFLGAFSAQAIPGTECHVTFSAGVAVPQTGDTLEDVIQRADAAAYTAKRNGKNCVVAA